MSDTKNIKQRNIYFSPPHHALQGISSAIAHIERFSVYRKSQQGFISSVCQHATKYCFWAWTWGSSITDDNWYQITKSGSTYYLTVPISSTGCKVLRFDPAIGSNAPDWNSSYKWSESNDNTISNTSSSIIIDFP